MRLRHDAKIKIKKVLLFFVENAQPFYIAARIKITTLFTFTLRRYSSLVIFNSSNPLNFSP